MNLRKVLHPLAGEIIRFQMLKFGQTKRINFSCFANLMTSVENSTYKVKNIPTDQCSYRSGKPGLIYQF